ncbi:hypothetical protein BDV40DRAFT_233197 [Aspergillus tamarii]|uniref:Uncharacterized protein n=1 Tax=Aspergillus tamarii TaxID=41984 RepID=A0A5N6ULT7_ASPTM|nr:hypothetical protein BDV40DRAFT_233197 [Aspergillus tamarii]
MMTIFIFILNFCFLFLFLFCLFWRNIRCIEKKLVSLEPPSFSRQQNSKGKWRGRKKKKDTSHGDIAVGRLENQSPCL